MDFTNLDCEHHSVTCHLFCRSCDFLVCLTCVSEDHPEHDLVKIKEAYQQKMGILKDVRKSAEDTRRRILTIKGNLVQHKLQQTKQKGVEENQSENQSKALNTTTDNHSNNHTSDLRLTNIFTAIDNDIKTLQRTEDEVEGDIRELEAVMNLTDLTKFFSDVLKLKIPNERDIPKTPSIFMSVLNCDSRDVTLSHTEDNGSLLHSSNIDLKIIDQYQTKLSAISHICSTSDGGLWLGSNIDDVINEVTTLDGQLKIQFAHNTPVYGMAYHDGLLISTNKTKPQQLDNNSGKILDTKYDISPFDVTAIHITKEGKMVFGGISDQMEKSVVFIMGSDNMDRVTLEQDPDGRPLFTYPYEITSTESGYIFVVDCHPYHGRGRVVILSNNGDIINIYNGHGEVNKDTPFIPASIATSPRGNVVVVDHHTGYLHILDPTGHLIGLYHTTKAGIQLPESLAFTSSGTLWIGCSTPMDSRDKAKLYHVNFAPF